MRGFAAAHQFGQVHFSHGLSCIPCPAGALGLRKAHAFASAGPDEISLNSATIARTLNSRSSDRVGRVVGRSAEAESNLAAGQETYAAEAQRGYDVDQILRRRRGRPAIGSAAASVESVRLDPDLKRDLLLRAAEDNTSVSDIIRRAIGAYLQASKLVP